MFSVGVTLLHVLFVKFVPAWLELPGCVEMRSQFQHVWLGGWEKSLMN